MSFVFHYALRMSMDTVINSINYAIFYSFNGCCDLEVLNRTQNILTMNLMLFVIIVPF